MLRELYRDAEGRGDTLSMHKLDECHDYAKRMQRRLMQLNGMENMPVIGQTKGWGDYD